MSEDQESTELQNQLFETKNKMKQEVDRFHKSEQILTEDKNSLLSASDTYKQYGGKLMSNFQKFKTIKEKSEQETLFLWYSFYFLIIVSLYIIFRRLGIIYILIQKPIIIIFKAIKYVITFLILNNSDGFAKSEL
ncbi:Sec20 family protein [Cryptosporidium meleagridis]|uniref:Sec20 family protein n=1 Tax=Cryptosporidium meleagridis TaxID=93969 RepID=A0A2P4YYS2_9CRYT|nr:Sec20 family protein [Cryptosporidium meleagridis]